jgi:hypothetical protein
VDGGYILEKVIICGDPKLEYISTISGKKLGQKRLKLGLLEPLFGKSHPTNMEK